MTAPNFLVLDGAVASLGLDGRAPWLTVLRDPGDGTALIDTAVLVDDRVVAHDEYQDRWYALDAATGHVVHSDVALSDLPASAAEAIRYTSAHDALPGALVSDWKFPELSESDPLDSRRVRSIPDEILTSQGAHLLARWAVGELPEDKLIETATELVASGCPDPLVLQMASLWHTAHNQSDEFSAWIRELGRRCDLTDQAGLGVLVAWLFVQSLLARTDAGLRERDARLLAFQHLFRHLPGFIGPACAPGGPLDSRAAAEAVDLLASTSSGMLTLVYLRNSLLLSKREYTDWREVQDQFFDYKASLGPFDIDQLFDFLDAEYAGGLFVRDQVELFVQSTAELMSGGEDTSPMVGPGWSAPST